MPTSPRSQIALAGDPNWQKRLSSLLVQEAIVISEEIPDPDPDIARKRKQLANQVVSSPNVMATSLSTTICNATNLVAADTTYNFEAFSVETSATDAEVRSQIASLWNVLAGI